MSYHLSDVRIREDCDVSFRCSNCKNLVRFDYPNDLVFRVSCPHCHSTYNLKKLVRQYNGGSVQVEGVKK